MIEESRAERIRYLVRVARSVLVRADALIQGDTEYLRDELNHLMENTDVLLEKMNFEQCLLELRDELHALAPEEIPPDAVRSAEETGTGVRIRLPD